MVMEAPATSGIQVAPNPPNPAITGGVQMVAETPLPPRGRTGGAQQPTSFVPMQQMGALQMGQQLIVQQQPQTGSAPLAAQPTTGQAGQQGSPSNIERIIGMEFVRQYYTMLHEKPHFLHRFYGKESFFLHGSSGEEEITIIGSDAIKHKFEGMSPKECFTRIFHVDCQNSINNSVVVQVFGELTTGGESRRQFVQTFVLANQAHRSYYIINDIFRYLSRSSSPTGTTSPVGGLAAGSESGLKGEEMPPVVQAQSRPRGMAAGNKETAGGELNGPSSGARPPSAPHPAAANADANTSDEANRAPTTSATNLTAQADSKTAASKTYLSASESGNANAPLTIATSSYVHTQGPSAEAGNERARNASLSVAAGGTGASAAQEAASDTSESKRTARAPKAVKSESATNAAVSNGVQREPPSKDDRTSPTPSGGQQAQASRESESAKSRPSGPRSWATIAAKPAQFPPATVAPVTQPAPVAVAASTTTPNEKVQKPLAALPKNKQPTVEAQTQAGRQSPTPGAGDPTIGEVEMGEMEEMQAGESSPNTGDAGRSPYGDYRGRGGRGPPPPTGDELYVTMLPPDWNEERVFNFFTSLKLGVVTFARWPPERPYCFVRMESAEAAQQVLNYAKQFNTDKNDPTFRIPIPGMDPKQAGRGLRVELRRQGMGPQGGGPRRSDMMMGMGMGMGGMMPRGRDREQRPGPPGPMFVPPARSSGGYARSGSGGRMPAAATGAPSDSPSGSRSSIGKPLV